ncbi:hypothetical protein Tsubulata_041201 [Turnera subulata]|uniref:Uncharacterized protein n=1 Tax=Turnera subulata TaxID=218843 RepID=A0A9Q0G0U1_9ROSI|nr:hypothetical protein Tsubulata_041201 [Turnera subulata]
MADQDPPTLDMRRVVEDTWGEEYMKFMEKGRAFFAVGYFIFTLRKLEEDRRGKLEEVFYRYKVPFLGTTVAFSSVPLKVEFGGVEYEISAIVKHDDLSEHSRGTLEAEARKAKEKFSGKGWKGKAIRKAEENDKVLLLDRYAQTVVGCTLLGKDDEDPYDGRYANSMF